MLLSVKCSKTIQFRELSLYIIVPSIVGSFLCPVLALHKFLSVANLKGSYPLFSFPVHDSVYVISAVRFTSMIKTLVSILGHDAVSFSLRSFHRGGATFAFSCGVPGETVKLQGDWKSDSYLVCLTPSPVQQMQALAPVSKHIREVTARVSPILLAKS